jgi:hypothetical protein
MSCNLCHVPLLSLPVDARRTSLRRGGHPTSYIILVNNALERLKQVVLYALGKLLKDVHLPLTRQQRMRCPGHRSLLQWPTRKNCIHVLNMVVNEREPN